MFLWWLITASLTWWYFRGAVVVICSYGSFAPLAPGVWFYHGSTYDGGLMYTDLAQEESNAQILQRSFNSFGRVASLFHDQSV